MRKKIYKIPSIIVMLSLVACSFSFAQERFDEEDLLTQSVNVDSTIIDEAVADDGGLVEGEIAESIEGADSLQVVDEGESDSSLVVMKSLFFSPTQRRILEVVRQGILDESSINYFEEELKSGPLILIEEELSDEKEVKTRASTIKVDAFIRNRSSGKSSIWLNSQKFDIDQNINDNTFLSSNGIILSLDAIGDDLLLRGGDQYSNSKFEAKIGQVINIDGRIEESLPVIITRKR